MWMFHFLVEIDFCHYLLMWKVFHYPEMNSVGQWDSYATTNYMYLLFILRTLIRSYNILTYQLCVTTVELYCETKSGFTLMSDICYQIRKNVFRIDFNMQIEQNICLHMIKSCLSSLHCCWFHALFLCLGGFKWNQMIFFFVVVVPNLFLNHHKVFFSLSWVSLLLWILYLFIYIENWMQISGNKKYPCYQLVWDQQKDNTTLGSNIFNSDLEATAFFGDLRDTGGV